MLFIFAASCATVTATPAATPAGRTTVDVNAIVGTARDLSADSLRGRGPWTIENEHVARRLAADLAKLGAKPAFGTSLLVPFTAAPHPGDTVYNVAGIIPGTDRATNELVGVTAHFDHLGVGAPDARGDPTDSIYNGFLDDGIGVGMSLDVARRFAQDPGQRSLLVVFFNLEEQGLLGSKAMVERADAPALLARLKLLAGIDAGSPAGEALTWQLMGALPPNSAGALADSLASLRGWTTTGSVPRPISDVYPFAQHGVPILFPIPGAKWKGYDSTARAASMAKFDHYHNPADEYRTDFPLVGTAAFADWVWTIVRSASMMGWR
jgi:Zn-dependent M28 family amino/carboxypeptidase